MDSCITGCCPFILLPISRIGPSGLVRFRIDILLGLLGWEIGPSQDLFLPRTTKYGGKENTDIHGSSGNQTHDLSVRAVQFHKRLRPGHFYIKEHKKGQDNKKCIFMIGQFILTLQAGWYCVRVLVSATSVCLSVLYPSQGLRPISTGHKEDRSSTTRPWSLSVTSTETVPS
jgi:hypothetical protein